ncbi:MAG TPA: hypothetical protein VHU87_15425 [Rhizomicrobium sp.]|jgi:hypothetical protein|nr:hypothetical protein [Rhizomicrobium sp.]
MLGHLVASHAADEPYAAPPRRGWLRRLIAALFWRRRYTQR